MNLKSAFKYVFALIVPSVVISFAANSIILVLSSILSFILIKKKNCKYDFKNILVFNSFSVAILLGFLIDFINNNKLDYNELIRIMSFILVPFIFIASTKEIRMFGIKAYIAFMTLLSSTLMIAGLIRAIVNRNEIIYGNWDSETTERLYQSEMLINWGELSYKRLFFFFDMHPSYYALFTILVIILLLFNQSIQLKGLTKKTLIGIHSIMIILVSSKTGILSLFIPLLIYVVGFYTKKSILIGAASVLFIGVMVTVLPSSQIRLNRAYDSLFLGNQALKNNSTSERLTLWKTTTDLDKKELFFGLGNTGGQKRITELTGIEKNVHNQFLQSMLNSGILGFLLLVTFVFLPLFYARNLLTFSLVSIVFLNLLFENMLDRVWGITVISFFYAYIIFGRNRSLHLKQRTASA